MTQSVERRNRWLVDQPAPTAAARVFCLPYSGCGASMYRQWPRLHQQVEFCPVQLPGRENRMREPTFETYGELAAAMADGLAPYLDRPYAFYGHCGSALAAYEATVALARGALRPPSRLFVSSQVAPQDGPAGRFLQMNEEQLGQELRLLIEQMGGTTTPELIELYLEVLVADVEANKRYVVPHPERLQCPVTAIGWSDDADVPPGAMRGWSACGETTYHVLEGGHHRFLEGPRSLLDLMVAELLVASPG